MPIFGCASDEQLFNEWSPLMESEDDIVNEELTERWSPCDNCDMNYINCCASCQFASPSINDSLYYKDDEDW